MPFLLSFFTDQYIWKFGPDKFILADILPAEMLNPIDSFIFIYRVLDRCITFSTVSVPISVGVHLNGGEANNTDMSV